MENETQVMQEAGETLKNFMGAQQLSVVAELLEESEEREYFAKIILELDTRITTMPETFGQDGKGDDAIVYLHYFINGCDFYITERDSDPDGEGQIQAFGYADIGMGCPELGYISIKEITDCGAELDFYWTPKTLREVKKERGDL
jgi:Protein of unknown function (DUF2958)